MSSPLDRIEASVQDAEGGRWCSLETADVLALVAVAQAAERVDAADADGQFGLLPLDGDACQALEALSEALSRLGKDTA